MERSSRKVQDYSCTNRNGLSSLPVAIKGKQGAKPAILAGQTGTLAEYIPSQQLLAALGQP
jgi:hypothetical protein